MAEIFWMNLYIYIYVLQKKKWGKIGPSFSMPNCWCFFPCHPSDVGETMPVRCTCLGRGGCFGLWGICELYLGAQAEPVFFYVWSSNTWHILTNGGRKSQKLQQKKVQRSHCSHSPSFLSSSPCAGNYKSWTTRTTNCTFQAVCAVYIESHRYNMMKPGSILICFIEIAVIFLIAAMT